MKNIHYHAQVIPFDNIKIGLEQLLTFLKQCHVHSLCGCIFLS